MSSARLSNLMGALRKLEGDDTLPSDERTMAAELAINDYLVKDPATRKQLLDELNREVMAGELWDTVRDVATQLRQTG